MTGQAELGRGPHSQWREKKGKGSPDYNYNLAGRVRTQMNGREVLCQWTTRLHVLENLIRPYLLSQLTARLIRSEYEHSRSSFLLLFILVFSGLLRFPRLPSWKYHAHALMTRLQL